MRSLAADHGGAGTEQGSATLELVVLLPVVIIALLFVIAAGRIAGAHGSVEAAARDAARQASIARDAATARRDALATAQATLTQEGVNCPAHVAVDTSQFARPVGQPATVTATVTCTVRLADVAPGGLPHLTITARFSSPLDPFRGRLG